jgi:hypothetical protein
MSKPHCGVTSWTQDSRGIMAVASAGRKGDSDVPFRILSTVTHFCASHSIQNGKSERPCDTDRQVINIGVTDVE